MKSLPENVKTYKQTPLFSENTVPKGLLKSHSTKEGSWGKIIVSKGKLLYRILEPEIEEIILTPDLPGIVEPTVKHEVQPLGEVSFHVEFLKKDL